MSFILSVIFYMLRVVILNVVMLSAVMLSVFFLCVFYAECPLC
jgi:hypothetical protein